MMECSICHGPVEPWPGNEDGHSEFGYGNNPEPVANLTARDRCCRWCNNNVVIPVRMYRMAVRP